MSNRFMNGCVVAAWLMVAVLDRALSFFDIQGLSYLTFLLTSLILGCCTTCLRHERRLHRVVFRVGTVLLLSTWVFQQIAPREWYWLIVIQAIALGILIRRPRRFRTDSTGPSPECL